MPNEKLTFKTIDGKTLHVNKNDIITTESANNGHVFKDTDTKITTKDGTFIVKERPSEVEKKLK